MLSLCSSTRLRGASRNRFTLFRLSNCSKSIFRSALQVHVLACVLFGSARRALPPQMESSGKRSHNGTTGASDAADPLSAGVDGTQGATKITRIEEGEDGAVRKAVKVSVTGKFADSAGTVQPSFSWAGIFSLD